MSPRLVTPEPAADHLAIWEWLSEQPQTWIRGGISPKDLLYAIASLCLPVGHDSTA